MDGAAAFGANDTPLSEDEYLEFDMELTDAESEVGECLEAFKAPKKALKEARKHVEEIRDRIAERTSIVAFDRAREDAQVPASERERRFQMHRRIMAFKGKPVGFQGTLDVTVAEPSVAALKEIDSDGYAAGKVGRHAEENPWTPGDERAARWESARVRGYTEWLEEQKRIAESMAPEPKRSRGRPRKDGSPAQPRQAAE